MAKYRKAFDLLDDITDLGLREKIYMNLQRRWKTVSGLTFVSHESMLSLGFTWDRTPEGKLFWMRVHAKFEKDAPSGINFKIVKK